MRIMKIFMWLAAFLAVGGMAMAGSVLLTFDSNNWGTSPYGTYNTTKSFEGANGNPGACVLFRGIGGVGGGFSNNGFTGDFGAQGFRRISFDLKKKHWFLRPNNQQPKAYIFARKQGHWVWAKQIQNFDPMATGYKNYFVDFVPDWSDAQAQANGWQVITGYGQGSTTSFSATFADVYQTGFWIQDMAPSECHVYVDNWRLGPAGMMAVPIKKPMKLKRKPMTKERYPMKKQ